jgi:hypothetical protein
MTSSIEIASCAISRWERWLRRIGERLEDLLWANDVHVISWVSGRVDTLPERFLRGELIAGVSCLGSSMKNTERTSREGR